MEEFRQSKNVQSSCSWSESEAAELMFAKFFSFRFKHSCIKVFVVVVQQRSLFFSAVIMFLELRGNLGPNVIQKTKYLVLNQLLCLWVENILLHRDSLNTEQIAYMYSNSQMKQALAISHYFGGIFSLVRAFVSIHLSAWVSDNPARDCNVKCRGLTRTKKSSFSR